MKTLLKIFFIVFLASFISAQNISAIAELDSSKYLVGDIINYKLTIERDKNISVLPFSIKDSLKELEYLKNFPVEKTEVNGKIKEVYKVSFSHYDSLNTELKGFKILYKTGNKTEYNFISTNSLPIEVNKLDVDRTTEFKDVKAPYLIPLNFLLIFLILLAVLILVLVTYFLIKKYKKKKEIVEEVVIINPYDEALAALKNVEESKLPSKGLIKEYHTELTYIIRRYFERLLEIPALEVTSSELLNLLKSIKIPNEIYHELKIFFENADMVKFAKYQPLGQINDEMMRIAYKILEVSKDYTPVKDEKLEGENV